GRQVAAGRPHLDAALHVLRRLDRGGGHRRGPARRPVRPGLARRDARARLAVPPPPAHPARPRSIALLIALLIVTTSTKPSPQAQFEATTSGKLSRSW